ncbi:hypothetical protein RchiOBHm_Chr1g0373961 [Rosa chinensis]|uniref:Uncharacterized protein n=1 Tax=Rosa chinensis TaxID=74649 RepID=A0A2P6SM89_ROSCH|nr:hypothetical protein RchiOBHm_Chr1g0373961 [Rosa chinensis]
MGLLVNGDEYPYEACQRYLDYLYDATRLCGSDCTSAVATCSLVEDFCGIKVLPDELEKKEGH